MCEDGVCRGADGAPC